MKTYEEMARDVLHRMDAYEKEQRAKKTKVRKMLPAFAAVTALVVCLPVGVYAYELYHKESVQKYIGVSGEQILTEYGYSAPQSFSNDKATLTIDTMLYDGHSALAVITIEAHDPAYTFPHDYWYLPEIVCDAEGNPIEMDLDERTFEGKHLVRTAMSMWKDEDLPANQCRYEIRLLNTEDWNGETLYMRFAYSDEKDYIYWNAAGRELLDGMIVSFDFTQNCDCETLTAENGEQIWLSDFELTRPLLYQHYAATGENNSTYKLIYNDGTEEDLRAVSGFVSTNITEYLAADAPYDDETATIIHKVSEIAAIEIDGIRYIK